MSIFNRRHRVAVLVNPHSGKNTKRAGLAKTLGSYLVSPSRLFAPATLFELDVAVAAVCRLRPDILVIIGGDGTVHNALTRLIHEYAGSGVKVLPRIVIVPAGSMNNLAGTFGATSWTVTEFVQRFKAKLDSGAAFDTARLAPLRCDDDYGITFCFGLSTAFLERYWASGSGGPLGAVRTAVGTLLDEAVTVLPFARGRRPASRPIPSEVILVDERGRRRSPYQAHTVVIAGVTETIGLGCRALPDARRDPGKFMIRASTLSFWDLATRLGQFWFGADMPGTFEGTATSAELNCETPASAMLDGDLLPARRDLRLSLGPELTFITG